MNFEEFILTSVNLPGLRDVMAGEKKEDYVFIWSTLVSFWGIDQFTFAMQRLNEVIKNATGIIFYLEAPSVRMGNYKLCCVNPNYQKK